MTDLQKPTQPQSQPLMHVHMHVLMHVLVLGVDDLFSAAVHDLLAAQLPGATCRRADPDAMRAAPTEQAIVIDARVDAPAALEHGLRLRAMNFAGAIVVVSDDAGAIDSRAARDGYAVIAPDQLAAGLVARLTEELERANSPYAPVVARARRLVAAGEIAARLQHALNNPLMGLLAETQLMQLDAVPADQAEALERMVGLCRRMIELTKSLDGLADRSRTA